ncbi:BrxA family protein [Gemmatimonadota bacterium]
MPFRSDVLNANLTKGTANSADILQLLRYWNPAEESPAEFQVRAVEENLLGKASRSRAEDVVKSVLSRRFFPNGQTAPADLIRKLSTAGVPRHVLDLILYYHSALAEHLLYVAAVEHVYELRTIGHDTVPLRGLEKFIDELSESGRIESTYTETVVKRLAQHILTAMRDYGILEGKAQKSIAPIHIPHEVVAYLAYALKDEGHTALRIARNPDWRLLLLHEREVEDLLLDGSVLGHFTYRSAGDVKRFDWSHENLEEYVDAIAG